MEFNIHDKQGYFDAIEKLHACISRLDISDHYKVSLMAHSLIESGFCHESRKEFSREARICPKTYRIQYFIDRYYSYKGIMPEVTEKMSLIGKLPKHWKEAIENGNLIRFISERGLKT